MQSAHQTVKFVRDRDGGVLLDIRGNRFYSLNDSAAEMWEQLSSGISIGEVANQVACKFEIPLPEATEDLATLVAQLQKLSLLPSFQRSSEVSQ